MEAVTQAQRADAIPAKLEADVHASGSVPAEQERTAFDLPVNIRSVSLAVLSLLASLVALQWAKAVFIPIMLSILFSYALSPIVNWLEQKRVPRWLGAAVLLLGILGAIGSTTYSLSNQASQLIDALPMAVQKFRLALQARTGSSASTLDTVQKVASQIEQAARESAVAGTSRGVMRVTVEPARFNIKDYLWTGTVGLAALIGQTMVVVFLTYFLMLSGDTFRRKLIKVSGPTLSSKKITLQALHEITGQIQRYLQVQLLTSALVGVLTGVALALLGLDNPVVWGITAGVLNLVPYVGSVITAGASALVAFLQFGSINMALGVGSVSLVIHTIVGNLVTPWLTSRSSRISPVAIFISLLAWGWLWGVWGLLLGVPIIMIIKSICDRVDDLKPIGEFLGS